MIHRFLIYILLFFITKPVIAFEESLRPGGIAIIEVNSIESNLPEITFRKRPVTIINKENLWFAVVGIPLNAKDKITINFDDAEKTILISDHKYKEQRLKIENKSQVNPNKNQLDRIYKERKIINAALNNFREIKLEDLSLAVPVDGPRSSSFGLRRFFNGQPRSPHSGMDISAQTGTFIKNPRHGIVTVTGDYFFNGKTVIIDHGQGFITMYCHLSEINVKEGDELFVNDLIGLVGATGRVTGPHLHFGTYLNGAAIDPEIFINDF